MNKPLLIVVCGFLIVSLLSLARFDEIPADPPSAQPQVSAEAASRDDLVNALQTALSQEQRAREQLQSQLDQSRTQVKTQEQLLAERDANLRNLQENLKQTEEQASQLDQERQALDQQVIASVRSIVDLEKQLATTSTESKVNQARLDALQAELKMREREADRLQDRLASVEERHQAAEAEKQQLAIKLQVTETEKLLVREQLLATREQVAVSQKEKDVIQETAKVLAAGVNTLAEKSGETQTTANSPLVGGFLGNLVESEFTGHPGGAETPVASTNAGKTVLLSSGGEVYAVFHLQATLLDRAAGQTNWTQLTGKLRRGTSSLSLDTLLVLQSDPRIVLAHLTADQAKELRVAVYPVAREPLKSSEAVLISAGEGYHGETAFKADTEAANYVHLPRARFGKVSGKFNPAPGDLVLNKTGEALGVMVNREYCLVLSDLTLGGTISLGATLQDPKNEQVLTNLSALVGRLPTKVK